MKTEFKTQTIRIVPAVLTRGAFAVLVLMLLGVPAPAAAETSPFSGTVGVSYGRLFASSPLPVDQAMHQIKQHFSLVRFYDFDEELMNAAVNQGLEIILTVPNEKLSQLDSLASAESYVTTSVEPWKTSVKTIIVGNEIFENGGQGQPAQVVGRMQNLTTALGNKGITHIPVTTNINLAVLAVSYPVDQSVFQNQYTANLTTILQYTDSGPGFVFVNIYPWYAIQQNPGDIKLGYATFQGPPVWCRNGPECQNLFEAQYLAWNYAVQALLPGNKTTAYIGETGWASAGGPHPELSTAEIEGTYINGYIKWVKAQTPAIPSLLFEMYDEPNKPGDNQEPHWGLFQENGTAKFSLAANQGSLATGNIDGIESSISAAVDSKSETAGTADARIRDDDLMGVTAGGQIYYTFGASNYSFQHLPGMLAQVACGDLDGDQIDECFGVTASGEIYHIDNDLTNWQAIPGRLRQIAACDLNGDKVEDLVGVTAEGHIYYTLDKSNWQSVPGVLSQLTCADLNGDGYGDLAGVTSSWDVYYTLDRENWQNIPGKLTQLASGHIFDDSQADLVGVDPTGHIHYSRNLLDWINVPGVLSQVTVGGFNSDLQGDLIGLTETGDIYYTLDLVNWQLLPGKF